MPKRVPQLTDAQVRNAKPGKHTDGGGLYLLVNDHSKRFYLRHKDDLGLEKTYTVGKFPEVGLAAARVKATEIKERIAKGEKPLPSTFQEAFDAWHKHFSIKWTKHHSGEVENAFKADLLPLLGRKDLVDIKPPHILTVLQKVEKRGKYDRARRMRAWIEQIFRFSIATGLVDPMINPAADIIVGLNPDPPKKQNMAALKPEQFPEFLKRLHEYPMDKQTRHAMLLLILCWSRTQEARFARWSEFNFEEKIWKIPGERMKMRKPHVVPLSVQALGVLKEQEKVSGSGDLVFPNEHDITRPISENTLLYGCIYRLGYRSRTSVHGFRALARSIAADTGDFQVDVMESALAHHKALHVGAYDRSEMLDLRRRLMSWWGDYVAAKGPAELLPPLDRGVDAGPVSSGPVEAPRLPTPSAAE